MKLSAFVPLAVTATVAAAGLLLRAALSSANTPPPLLAPPSLPTLPQESGLTFDVRDAENGAPIPCKLTADGVEVIVSTDHNVVSDYAPIIQDLGVGRYITSLTGDELTTGSWGHFGAFPLPQQLERAGSGAILVHGRTAIDYFKDVRVNAP